MTGLGGDFGLIGTRVLSPDQLDYNGRLGDRLSLGMWIDDAQNMGITGNAYVLRTGTTTSGTFSNASGSLPLRALFINTPPGAGFPLGESSFVLSDPGFATGGQSLYSSTDFWGTELNGLYRFWNNDMVNMSMLGGFRYLGLHENLTITNKEKLIGVGFGTYTGTDNFGTRNQFYSGQLGIKAEARYQQYFSCIQGNVALGVNQQTVALNGNSTIVGPHTVTMPGGVYIQKSNTGTQTKNEFSVAPEVKLEFGMDITKHISALFGYDFIYMSNVVRPGDQIDRTLNLTQNAVLDTGVLVGAARPQPLFHTSSFWAQGINLGLQLNW
jgi:hypothetical protein